MEHFVNIWPDNELDKQKYLEEVWNLIEEAYKPIGGAHTDKTELLSNNVYWKLVMRQGKVTAVCCYKITKFGRKLFVLASDGTTDGKKDLQKIMSEDISQEERIFYAEVSGAPEHIYINKISGKTIDSKQAQDILGQEKQIIPETDDEYHYTRQIGDKVYRKVMVGNPKV